MENSQSYWAIGHESFLVRSLHAWLGGMLGLKVLELGTNEEICVNKNNHNNLVSQWFVFKPMFLSKFFTPKMGGRSDSPIWRI